MTKIKRVEIHWGDRGITPIKDMKDFKQWVEEIIKVGFVND